LADQGFQTKLPVVRLLYVPRCNRRYQHKADALKRIVGDEQVWTHVSSTVDHAKVIRTGIRRWKPTHALVEHNGLWLPDGLFHPEVLDIIAREHVPILCWNEEIRTFYPGDVRRQFPLIHRMYMNHADPDYSTYFIHQGVRDKVRTLYGSEDPFLFRSDEDVEKAAPEYDVVFAGNNYISPKGAHPYSGIRLKLLQAISRAFNFAYCGAGWEQAGLSNHKGILGNEDLVRFYKSGKVVLGVNHYDIKGYYPERLFQGIASARSYATWEIRGLEVEFGDAIPVFRSIENAVAVVKGLLTFDQWKKYARRQRTVFLERHLWDHHYGDMLKEFL